MTQTKTAINPGYALILASLVFAGAFAFMALGKGPGTDPSEDTTEKVILIAEFAPTPRPEGIHVVAMVEGVEVVNELLAVSPWTKEVIIPRGAQISMNVQQVKSGLVACFIEVNGKRVATNVREDIGSVRCWHNRKSN